jgi:hypothetical protein
MDWNFDHQMAPSKKRAIGVQRLFTVLKVRRSIDNTYIVDYLLQDTLHS